jgi:hypothetical protein
MDLLSSASQKEALIKALNRMVASGKIAKLSKGKYYKPEATPFGALVPSQYQAVKDLLERRGKVVGYLTGLSVYNQLGLTTQVSNTIQIGKNEIRAPFKRGQYTISFIKQKNIITKENVPLFQILDALRMIKKIPNANIEQACRRLKVLVSKRFEKEQVTMLRLAHKYPPATRALLGAMVSEGKKGPSTAELMQSLNPVSTYNLPGASTILVNAERWNIV